MPRPGRQQRPDHVRSAHLDVTEPAVFASGILATQLGNEVTPDVAACNLEGTATFSWLLQFDTVANTIRTGGARPVADATTGYTFADESITAGASFHVQPTTLTATLASSGTFSSSAGDLIVPVFLDAAGTHALLLPLHAARFVTGMLSADHNCVGSYNASTLDPTNNCQPDATHKQFSDGGELDGYITLEEADTDTVSVLNESLCVLLSGDPATYGATGGDGVVRCKRNSMTNAITFHGMWCASTNSAASATCADAERVHANFAAASVLIH